MKRDWMDVPPMIFTGNPLIIKPGMVFFMHMILMDSKAQLAMNLGETYLVTETGNERLGKQKLDLMILQVFIKIIPLIIFYKQIISSLKIAQKTKVRIIPCFF